MNSWGYGVRSITSIIGVSALVASVLGVSSAATGAPEREPSDVTATGQRLGGPVMLARPAAGLAFKGPNHQWTGEEDKPRSPICGPHVCVHWTAQGEDAPPPADANSNNVPDQAERTLAAANTSWTTIVGKLGFRAPLQDVRSKFDGGNGKLDIHLADIGDKKMAGYTSSDDRRLADKSSYKFRDVSAFIVVDDDFASGQFGQGSPLDNLRVTVAHELVHASQFAYDYKEDKWLTEGTAAWVEDEVFDGVNLNRRYFKHSPLTNPLESLDYGKRGHEYGSWVFLRYLAERFGKDIVRKVWRYADDSPTEISPKRSQTYSMVAVRRALATEKKKLSDVFAAFARDNLRPGRTYREGGAYPRPTSARFVLDRHAPNTGWLGTPIDHMAAQHVTLVPGEDVRLKGRVRIQVDGPDLRLDPEFRISVRFAKGKPKDFVIGLNAKGKGGKKVPFGRKRVEGVDITMANASSDMRACFKRSTPFSCSGKGVDGRIYRFKARLG